MKNNVHDRFAEVDVALTVPTGTVAGNVVAIGTKGLFAVAETDQFVAATYTGFLAAPQGLKDGQATVRLIGVHTVQRYNIDAAGIPGDPVYITAANILTQTQGSNTRVGFLLDTLSAAGPGRVAMRV